MTTSTFEKSIRYDRETRDYAAYLDDRLIGFFANYHAAEVELDRVAHELALDYCEQGLIDTLTVEECTINCPGCAACDPPGENPLGDSEGDPEPPDRPRAVTLQSIQIEAKITTCTYCRGIHHIQKCPHLCAALFTDTSVELGSMLCGLLWRDPAGFRVLIESLSPTRLAEYALSYIAFLREYRKGSIPTVAQVIGGWLPRRETGTAVAA